MRVFSASHRDASQGRAAELAGGLLSQCPDMSEPGVMFEFVIEWEEINVNVDGAVFHPTLSSDPPQT